MDISLIIYIIIFLGVIVLFFKLIKKVIFAIFASLMFIVLILAGISGLLYMDYQDIFEQENFDLNLVYGNLENGIHFGLILPFEDKKLVEEKIVELDILNLNEEKLKKTEDIYILISEKFLKSIMADNQTFYLEGTKDFKLMDKEINTALTKSEVLNILESDDGVEKYIDIIFDKNEFLIENALIKKGVEVSLKSKLDKISLKSALFASIVKEAQTKDVITFIDGIKENEIEIYPRKFVFKLIDYLPTSFFKKLIEEK